MARGGRGHWPLAREHGVLGAKPSLDTVLIDLEKTVWDGMEVKVPDKNNTFALHLALQDCDLSNPETLEPQIAYSTVSLSAEEIVSDAILNPSKFVSQDT